MTGTEDQLHAGPPAGVVHDVHDVDQLHLGRVDGEPGLLLRVAVPGAETDSDHADVARVPIDDIGPSEVCLAWSADRDSPLLSDFADIAAAQH
ncbi:hypothetical protein [Streptomyces sp. NBC_01565]|uniref:hypothetical protein n=1 Tax=unclassified Streptomyces TaxID=2593676 RepID=UPI0022579ACB|nr:hypothetical protein [Streptomyces sp. NBC_01565]MCX4539368.1 hypothetical protein [Streptomyces sp. NBC_01565]